MRDFISVKMCPEDMLELLVNRVRYWTEDEDVVSLYEKMYDDYIFNGCFETGEFDVKQIVDNDWVNYTAVISEGDTDFEKLSKVYEEQGRGDCSSEDFDEYKISFIEAVDDEQNPKMFLVRL